MTLFKLLAAFIIFLITVLAAWKPLHAKLKNQGTLRFPLGDAFASGIFLGAALFHMLPDAQKAFHQSGVHSPFPIANFLCATSFVVLLGIEKLFLGKRHTDSTLIAYVLTFALSIHAFLAGTAFGISQSFAMAVIIFIAIIAHKGSESFALATTLYRSSLATKKFLSIFFLFSLITPLGVILGSILANSLNSHHGLITEGIFNALAAGTFLYIATVHSDVESGHSMRFRELIALIIGLVLMAVISIWV